MNFDIHDQQNHPRQEDSQFSLMTQVALGRRTLLQTLTTSAIGFLFSSNGLAKSLSAQGGKPQIGFQAVAANSLDTITLPPGYRWDVLCAWGDGILSGATAFDPQTRGTAQSQALAMGDNNDGMSFFPLNANTAVMAVNNEYTNYEYLFPAGRCTSLEDAQKAQAAHGVSIFEVKHHGQYTDAFEWASRRACVDADCK